jgi:putative phosphoesterase
MKIAILSDTHDNVETLARALPGLQAADVVLHCGDVCSPFTLKRLAEGMGAKPVHLVWGNNDGDRRMLAEVAAQAGNVYLHGEFADFTLGDLRVAMSHYPAVARAVAASGQYGLVCYGHDHQAHEERLGATLLLNPGELAGVLTGRATWART